MTKLIKWPLYLTIVFFLFVSCTKIDIAKKSEVIQSVDVSNSEGSDLYEQAIKFLIEKRDNSPEILAKKVDTLLRNLSNSYTTVIKLTDSIDVFVCDLTNYKNESIPEYERSHYKMYFEVTNGTIKGGLIYTIHTNFPSRK